MGIKGKKIRGGLLVSIGYILSPLSFWNDLFVNIPIAYALSIPFSFISKNLWIYSFIFFYWLTNWLGFFFMHKGVEDLVDKKLDMVKTLIISIVYTIIISYLALNSIIPNPSELFK